MTSFPGSFISPPLTPFGVGRQKTLGMRLNTVFSFNGHLYKQIDRSCMGNPLSPVLANIFIAKLEANVVQPFNPPFYDWYFDDCFSKKEKKTSLMINLSISTVTIITSFLLLKKILTISLTLLSLMLTSSTAKSTRNQEN